MKIHLRCRPSANIVGVCAGNNVLLLALANGRLLRIPLQHVDRQIGRHLLGDLND